MSGGLILKYVQIGICLFDGSMNGLENHIPFVTCGVLDFFKGKAKKCDELYCAGWDKSEGIIISAENGFSRTEYEDDIIVTSYFLPLDILTNQEQVQRYIVEPLLCLYEENKDGAKKMIEGVEIGIGEIEGTVQHVK